MGWVDIDSTTTLKLVGPPGPSCPLNPLALSHVKLYRLDIDFPGSFNPDR